MNTIRHSAALAAATATVLATTAFAVPALAADDPPQAPGTIELSDATLEWGVKESFRSYVAGMAKGEITTGGGAEQAADNGPFTFSGGTGSYDLGTHSVNTSFPGDVRFRSTAHGFDIRLSDVKLVTEGRTGGSIVADITAAGETRDDVELADLDLSEVRPGSGAGGAMTFAGIPTTMTEAGAAAFNGMYQKGTVLDPATLTVQPAATGGTSGGSESGGSGTGGTDGGSESGGSDSGGTDTGGSTGGSDSGGSDSG
ncbi:HtaA domain-containing protein, partial [Streptomyces sparsus]